MWSLRATALVPALGALATTTYTFAPIAPIPIGTTEAQSVALAGKLYVFGGFDLTKPCCTPTNRAYVYDPAANRWTALPAMPGHGVSHAGIATDGTRYIYYAGGYVADATATGQVYGTTAGWRYDTVTGAYAALPALPAARAAGGLAYVSGRLYYFGGSNLARTLDEGTVWRLNLGTGATTWRSRAPMPNPRNHLGWAVIKGAIYAVGGQHLTSSATPQSELDRYDPGTNTWTKLAALPVARSHVMDTTFVLNGRLVVAAGYTSSAPSAAVTAYTPSTNSWQALTSLPEARTSATAKAVGSGSYVYCCGSSGTSTSTGWLASPAP